MANEQTRSSRIVDALELLAADYESQLAQFPEYVHIPDELALIFSDCVLELQRNIDVESLDKRSQQVYRDLVALDQLLDEMESDRTNWTLEGLRDNVTWKTVRHKARQILARFNTSDSVPDLSWIQYVGYHRI